MSIAPITELCYSPDSCVYFDHIRGEAHPIFLDSCHPYSPKGRYDILSAAPEVFLTTHGATTTITRKQHTLTSEADPFVLLKTELAHYPERPTPLPFSGGALGYFGYDLNQRLEQLPPTHCTLHALPDMAVGIYLWAIITDHVLQKTYLLEPPAHLAPSHWDAIKQRLLTLSPLPPPTPFYFLKAFTANMTASLYAEKFAQIMQHLQQGDCYQINFAQRWQAEVAGDPWALYCYLRQHNPAPFAAFIPLAKGAILSCSPEQFLTVNTLGQISTHPIKGTRARNSDQIADQQAGEDLLNSPKDRAENTMIVDLMRNDLGKSCEVATVKVPKLCSLQSFAAVHHLVSTITGQLRPDKHPLDLLRDCFPGGSITGAPKIRAMELINHYEPHARTIYCGSIGYIDVNGHMDTNIAIRTALVWQQQCYVWGGGGIVIDSQQEQEYQETFDKIKPFLDAAQVYSFMPTNLIL